MKTVLQTILFDKDKWTLVRARRWLARHNYKTDVDEREHQWRFRQAEPNPRGNYFSVPAQQGIQMVLFKIR